MCSLSLFGTFKIYEIISYSLFSIIVEELGVYIEVGYDPNKIELLKEFEELTNKIITINSETPRIKNTAQIYRVGVTNAADRGLDMWANYGPAIQVKHLTLDPNLAQDIIETFTSDKIVIVCKDADEEIIRLIINQVGDGRIQGIITENELIQWYEKATKGNFSKILGQKIMDRMSSEILDEFPTSNQGPLEEFMSDRDYDSLSDDYWNL